MSVQEHTDLSQDFDRHDKRNQGPVGNYNYLGSSATCGMHPISEGYPPKWPGWTESIFFGLPPHVAVAAEKSVLRPEEFHCAEEDEEREVGTNHSSQGWLRDSGLGFGSPDTTRTDRTDQHPALGAYEFGVDPEPRSDARASPVFAASTSVGWSAPDSDRRGGDEAALDRVCRAASATGSYTAALLGLF